MEKALKDTFHPFFFPFLPSFSKQIPFFQGFLAKKNGEYNTP